jgi:hypothetical protein
MGTGDTLNGRLKLGWPESCRGCSASQLERAARPHFIRRSPGVDSNPAQRASNIKATCTAGFTPNRSKQALSSGHICTTLSGYLGISSIPSVRHDNSGTVLYKINGARLRSSHRRRRRLTSFCYISTRSLNLALLPRARPVVHMVNDKLGTGRRRVLPAQGLDKVALGVHQVEVDAVVH